MGKPTLKRIWKHIGADPILTVIVGGLLLTAILGIIAYFYSLIKDVKFGLLANGIFNYKFPLWIYVLSTIAVLFIIRLFKIKQKPNDSYDAIAPAKHLASYEVIQNSLAKPAAPNVPENLIFDSNIVDETFFDGYGQKNWDEKTQNLVGNIGIGSYSFQDKIITVDRTNIDGRYIIELKKYYQKKLFADFISANVVGKRKRDISVTFFARAFSNFASVKFVFKKNGKHDHINSYEYKIQNGDWQKFITGFAIDAYENFKMEFQTFLSDGKASIIQLKDIYIVEK
jgi:hypothetical protein